MKNKIYHEKIIGSRRFSNYFWSIFLFFGGIYFLLLGYSSYFNLKLYPFFHNSINFVFIPQGILMVFYGTLSLLISIYIITLIIFDVGSGYNEYNQFDNLVKIVRKGFPGKNQNILLTYSFSNIQSIGFKITQGLNPERVIYLCLKDERKIPITPVNEILSIEKLEQQASDLAKLLNLKLETL